MVVGSDHHGISTSAMSSMDGGTANSAFAEQLDGHSAKSFNPAFSSISGDGVTESGEIIFGSGSSRGVVNGEFQSIPGALEY